MSQTPIIDLYERHAEHFDRDHSRSLLAESGAPLMFTSGTSEGEAIGSFSVQRYVPNDPECGEHTVWLAVHFEKVPA